MAVSAGVAVSSISVAGGVVTVNTTSPHGLVASQGFSLQGTTGAIYNTNQTVSTAPNSTSITFPQGGLSAAGQAGAGGTLFPAKQIIILGISASQGAPEINVEYLLWLAIKVPVPTSASSRWPNASAAEVAAIAAGFIREVAGSKSFAQSGNKAHIQLELSNEYTAQQVALNASVQPGQFFGVFNDGVGWSA